MADKHIICVLCNILLGILIQRWSISLLEQNDIHKSGGRIEFLFAISHTLGFVLTFNIKKLKVY